jgi:hypothetical protein
MKDKTILLIPSTNGLGHARRLLHLVKNWNVSGKITMLLTKVQYEHLEMELKQVLRVNFELKILFYEGIGLDGYANLRNPKHPTSLDQEIVSEFSNAQIIISDNCIWPLYFRSDSVLLGHFLWHDVLPLSVSRADKSALAILELEKDLLSRVRNVLGLKAFTFGQMSGLVSSNLILFPNYFNGDWRKPLSDEIWYSQGTTGLNTMNVSQDFGSDVILKETYRILESPSLPKGVMGRPGLGTIRDCVEFQVPFFPTYSGNDIELKNNSQVIESLPGIEKDIKVGSRSYTFREIFKDALIGETTFSEFNARLK